MIVSVPSSAFGREPDTGASRNDTPSSASRSPMARAAVGAMVDMSIAKAPSPSPCTAPCSPSNTSSTCGASGTIVITTDAPSAASRGVAAALAPCSSANRSAFSLVRV